MELTRQQAHKICLTQGTVPINWNKVPIEAGMAGCPWRIMVTLLVARNLSNAPRTVASDKSSKVALKELFRQWPQPWNLSRADRFKLTEVMEAEEIRSAATRARMLLKFTYAWLGEDWDTIIDLPYMGADSMEALEKYVKI